MATTGSSFEKMRNKGMPVNISCFPNLTLYSTYCTLAIFLHVMYVIGYMQAVNLHNLALELACSKGQ